MRIQLDNFFGGTPPEMTCAIYTLNIQRNHAKQCLYYKMQSEIEDGYKESIKKNVRQQTSEGLGIS